MPSIPAFLGRKTISKPDCVTWETLLINKMYKVARECLPGMPNGPGFTGKKKLKEKKTNLGFVNFELLGTNFLKKKTLLRNSLQRVKSTCKGK